MAMSQDLNFREFLLQTNDWEIAAFYQQGMKIREISKITHLSTPEIYRSLKRAGGYPNRIIPQHDIVRMYAGHGLSNSHIADLTGYTSRHVRNILK